MSQTITGDKFKKMIMQAGHTKGYISSGAKQQLKSTTLHTGAKASSLLHNSTAHVSRADATKIIKEMKAKGLAHGVIGSAQEYVRKAFKQEQAQRDMIKRQNVGARAQEMAAEKAQDLAAATAKTGKVTKPTTAVHLKTTPMSPAVDKPNTTQPAARPVVSAMSSLLTPKKSLPSADATAAPNISPNRSVPPVGQPEEIIDLAID